MKPFQHGEQIGHPDRRAAEKIAPADDAALRRRHIGLREVARVDRPELEVEIGRDRAVDIVEQHPRRRRQVPVARPHRQARVQNDGRNAARRGVQRGPLGEELGSRIGARHVVERQFPPAARRFEMNGRGRGHDDPLRPRARRRVQHRGRRLDIGGREVGAAPGPQPGVAGDVENAPDPFHRLRAAISLSDAEPTIRSAPRGSSDAPVEIEHPHRAAVPQQTLDQPPANEPRPAGYEVGHGWPSPGRA